MGRLLKSISIIYIFYFNSPFLLSSVLVLVRFGYGMKHPVAGKQLVNFITCGCESSAPVFNIIDVIPLCLSKFAFPYFLELFIFFESSCSFGMFVESSIPFKHSL
jgi:hypothetical protein